jgi:hypothetical protein
MTISFNPLNCFRPRDYLDRKENYSDTSENTPKNNASLPDVLLKKRPASPALKSGAVQGGERKTPVFTIAPAVVLVDYESKFSSSEEAKRKTEKSKETSDNENTEKKHSAFFSSFPRKIAGLGHKTTQTGRAVRNMASDVLSSVGSTIGSTSNKSSARSDTSSSSGPESDTYLDWFSGEKSFSHEVKEDSSTESVVTESTEDSLKLPDRPRKTDSVDEEPSSRLYAKKVVNLPRESNLPRLPRAPESFYFNRMNSDLSNEQLVRKLTRITQDGDIASS